MRRLISSALDYTFPLLGGVAGWLDAASFGGMSRWLRDDDRRSPTMPTDAGTVTLHDIAVIAVIVLIVVVILVLIHGHAL